MRLDVAFVALVEGDAFTGHAAMADLVAVHMSLIPVAWCVQSQEAALRASQSQQQDLETSMQLLTSDKQQVHLM